MKITKAQIEQWKKEYFAVYLVTGENNEMAYLSYPTWTQWKAIYTAGMKSESDFTESFLNNCWLGGDEVIKENRGYFDKIQKQINIVFEMADATVEKVENHFVVRLKASKAYDNGKELVFALKPQTREMLNTAERNADNTPFSKELSLLELSHLYDSKKVLQENLQDKNPYYLMPLLKEVEVLFEKKVLSIKKL